MAKKTKKTKEEQRVEIPPLNKQILEVRIIGDSPLIQHAWSEKVKKQMLDKQMKKAKQGREAKNPERDYRESLYWLNKKGQQIPAKNISPKQHGIFGIKCVSFKAAMVRAANDVGLTMTDTRRAFHVLKEFAVLKYKKVQMREDMVKLNGKTADLRYRGEFIDWSCKIQIQYNAELFSPEQIINMLNTAGFGVGVGEWRPEKNGNNGMFHVE